MGAASIRKSKALFAVEAHAKDGLLLECDCA